MAKARDGDWVTELLHNQRVMDLGLRPGARLVRISLESHSNGPHNQVRIEKLVMDVSLETSIRDRK